MESSFALEDSFVGLLDFAPAATVAPVAALPAAPIAAASFVDPPSSPAAQPATAAAPAPVIDPIAAWEAAVADQMQTGCNRAAAVRTVASTQRELHASYIAEHNARERRRSAPSRTSPAPADPIAAWEAAIRAEMRTSNCTRTTATRNVACSQKQLHADFLAAFNQQAQAAR